ncbi:hypothetical protein ACWGKW_42055 [Streptomyces sp. NPDC054766]
MLPKDAGPNRRYCDVVCRRRHWRRVQRHDEIYQRAVWEGLRVIRGETLYGQSRCRVCDLPVSLRKRTDSVYCSAKCRTRAWRLRRQAAVG